MTYIAIGCSFTEDIYPGDVTPWPSQLSNKLNGEVINYGVRGSGLNYAARTLYETYYRYKPKGYFIQLSQWDRKEIGKFKQSHSKWPLKTKHIRPKENDDISQYIKFNQGLSDVWLLDPEWVINQAAYNLLSMIHFCKLNNLELYVHQLMWPLHAEQGQLDICEHYYQKSLWPIITNWIEDDQYIFCDKLEYYPYSRNVNTEDVSEKIMLCKFTRYNSTHTLGFHNLPGSNGTYKNVYDCHPNEKGHQMIANMFYEKWKNGQSVNA